MAKAMTLLAIFFLIVNVWSGILINSGVAGEVGISPPTAGDKTVDNASQQADKISSGTESKDTLFGLYNRVTTAIGTILGTLTAGAAILNQIGIPSVFTTPLEVVLMIIYGLGTAQFLRGFNL